MNRDRFKDLEWMHFAGEPVIVGGAGGIGSMLSFLLSRAGLQVYLYDADSYEEHNLGGQLVGKSSIGKAKVEAMQSFCEEFADPIVPMNEWYTEKSMRGSIMISGFDNMKARKIMYERWLDQELTPKHIFIDGRLAAQSMIVFCVTKATKDKYRDFLWDDSEVEELPCTARQTSHVAAVIAGTMVAFLTNHLTNVLHKSAICAVPFYHEYLMENNLIINEP